MALLPVKGALCCGEGDCAWGLTTEPKMDGSALGAGRLGHRRGLEPTQGSPLLAMQPTLLQAWLGHAV